MRILMGPVVPFLAFTCFDLEAGESVSRRGILRGGGVDPSLEISTGLLRRVVNPLKVWGRVRKVNTLVIAVRTQKAIEGTEKPGRQSGGLVITHSITRRVLNFGTSRLDLEHLQSKSW